MSLQKSKSILARLFAEENLTVQHKNTQTAYFLLKDRVLVCPVWKEMSPELYDLLMAHEVGHALFTPAEGWHDALDAQKSSGYKSYLNVVEDARIEKKVKEKFPGLRRAFYTAYRDLFNREFFGIKGNENVSHYPLIDRINLHFKVGNILNVNFSDEEKDFVRMVDECATWDDVVRTANALYEHAKSAESLTDILVDIEDGKYSMSEDDDEDGDYVDDDGDGDEFDSDRRHGDGRSMRGGSGGSEDPRSLTDDAFRRRERDLVSEASDDYVYVNQPKLDMTGRIIPHKRVYQSMTNYWRQYSYITFADARIDMEALFRNFRVKNEKYIAYMIKEFELRKNARQFARAAISTTGELDMKKIHSYRLTDDLFRKMTIVPQGKSHGLVMFIDFSGSMSGNIHSTIEQTLVLATFCRKIGVPFNVYSFTDLPNEDEKPVNINLVKNGLPGDVFIGPSIFRLREYLSSSMSSREFAEASKYLLYLAEGFEFRNARIMKRKPAVPRSDTLHGTPLDECIMASNNIVREFRKAYKLDIVNAIFLTDGAANGHNRYFTEKGGSRSFHEQIGKFSGSKFNLVITDQETKNQGISKPGHPATYAYLEILKKNTGCNVIGFYLMDRNYSGMIRQYCREMSKKDVSDDETKSFRNNRFFAINSCGYDVFYMLPGGHDLEIQDETLQVNVDATKNEIKKAFMKNLSKKAVNRIFLNRFIEHIS